MDSTFFKIIISHKQAPEKEDHLNNLLSTKKAIEAY